jgi:hypothetical protein
MVDPNTPFPYHDPWQPTTPPPASGPPNSLPPVTSPYPVTSPQPVTSPYPVTSPQPVTSPYPATEPVIAQIGEIQVTATTVRTPAGEFPLKGSQWTVTDQWTAEQKIPTWAIVLAIVGFFCLTIFSLLFLLAKETVYHGVVLVQVNNGPYHYVSRVPVTNQMYVQHIYQQVNYVRSLAAL